MKCIRSKSREAFKNVVKLKAKELALKKLTAKKDTHSKMTNLNYAEIAMQKYMLRENLKKEQKILMFKYRTRMTNMEKILGDLLAK